MHIKSNAEQTLKKYLQGFNNKYDRKKNLAIQKVIGSSLENKKVLDLGCGGGFFSIWFAKRGAQVWGVDIINDKIAAARLFAEQECVDGATHFIQGDVCEIEIPQKFDIIFAKDIIEHVDEDRFIKNIKRHSKPECELIVCTQNILALQYLIVAIVYKILGRGPYLGQDSTHIRMYSPRSLKRLLKRYKFRICKYVGCYHIPYRLMKGLLPIGILEFLPFHILEDLFKTIWPFDRTGWSIIAICKLEKNSS